jgi:hypothetical protein
LNYDEAASIVIDTLKELNYKNIKVFICCFDEDNYESYLSKI